MSKAMLAAWMLLAATTTSQMKPLAVVQSSVARLVAVARDTELARPANTDKRRSALRAAAESLFDVPEMARSVLARHWAGRSAPERGEFVRRFTDLLERSYVEQIEHSAGGRLVYVGESIDGDHAAVSSKIVTARRTEIPVEYRLVRTGLRWAVYDVSIEGVSLVASYRLQFDRLMRTESFPDVLRTMSRPAALPGDSAPEAR
jgi:phospholipid transport system substrate-binding protein